MLGHGKRDLGILMISGSTGQMMDLVSLSSSRYVIHLEDFICIHP